MRLLPRTSLFRIATALALSVTSWAGCDAGPDDDDSLSRVAGPTSEWPSRVPREGEREQSEGRDPSRGPRAPATEKPTIPGASSGDHGGGSDAPSKNPDSNATPPPQAEGPADEGTRPSKPTPSTGGMGGLGTFDAGVAAPQGDAGVPTPADDAGQDDEEVVERDGGHSDASLTERDGGHGDASHVEGDDEADAGAPAPSWWPSR